MRSLFLPAAVALFFAGEPLMAETIDMHVDGVAYAVELFENDAAKAFARRLPQTLQFEDYGRTERIAYLNPKLQTGRAPSSIKPAAGDLAYYMPWGNLAVFLHAFRESDGLVPLGRLTPDGLEALAKSSDRPVSFTARGKEMP